MNVRSAAAVLVVLLWANSFALAADTREAPTSGLLFPESVERAMMGEAAAKSGLRMNEFRSYSEWDAEGTVKKPIGLPIEKSHPPRPEPLGTWSEEPFVPFTSAAAPPAKDLPLGGKVADAITALRNYPKLLNEYVFLYYFFAREGHPNEAKSSLEKALIEYPIDPEPWTILGRIALHENRNGEAELDFLKAKQLLAGSPDTDHKKLVEKNALNGMAQVAERREQWPEAKSRLEDYLKKSPEDLDALQRLARATFCDPKFKAGRDESVAATYGILKRAKEIDLRNAEKNHASEMLLPAAALLAQLYDKYEHSGRITGRSHHPEDMYRYALKQSPDDLNLRAIVADWALNNGETDLAQEQADAALSIEAKDNARPAKERKYANSAAGHMVAGEVALWKREWLNAENHFQMVIKAAPQDFHARDKLALALVEQNVPTKQAKGLDLAYGNYQNNKGNNHNIEAAATLSWVYFRMGKFDLASAAMDAVLRATNGNVSDSNAATHMAYILDHNDNGHNGLKHKAKQILDAIIKTNEPFRMKPEAEKLYEKLKDEKPP